MKASEIDGERTFRQWFDQQPLAVRMDLVSRMALRLSPLHLRVASAFSAADDRVTLAVFRAALLLALGSKRGGVLPVAATVPALALAELIYEAAEDDYERGRANNNSIRAALCIGSALKALHAISMSNVVLADNELREALGYFFGSDHIGDTEALAMILASDTTREADDAPNFFRGMHDYELRAWNEQDAATLLQEGGRWTFWCGWYEDIFANKEPTWRLLYEVALIPESIWQQGPDAVAANINEIERSLQNLRQRALEDAMRQNPFALRIDVDAGSSTFVADELRPFDLSDIIEAVAMSMRDFTRRTAGMMTGNQAGSALRETVNPAVKELRRDLKRYADSPLKLHDAIGDAIQEVVASARREGVQSEPVLQRLIGVWARQQTDLCGTCPELLEMVQRRTMVQVKLFTEAELRQALTLGQGLHDRSSGYLRVAAAWALKTIQDPSRPKEELQSAWYFLAAVLPRGADAAIRFEEGRKSAKEGGVAKKVKDAADIAVAGDKIVDVAQENASELAELGQRIVSEITSGNWFGYGGGLG